MGDEAMLIANTLIENAIVNLIFALAVFAPFLVMSAYGLWTNTPLVMSNRRLALWMLPELVVSALGTALRFGTYTTELKGGVILSLLFLTAIFIVSFRNKGFMVLGASKAAFQECLANAASALPVGAHPLRQSRSALKGGLSKEVIHFSALPSFASVWSRSPQDNFALQQLHRATREYFLHRVTGVQRVIFVVGFCLAVFGISVSFLSFKLMWDVYMMARSIQ